MVKQLICFLFSFSFALCGWAETQPQSFEREGLNVSFSIKPVLDERGALYAGDIAEVTLNITESDTGTPVAGLYPAAWIDPAFEEDLGSDKQCRQKASTFFSGYVGIRPMIDLNSYYLVVMNNDPTLAVIDPIVGVRGITKLLTQIVLPSRGEDWVVSKDETTLFVVMPELDALAIVDLKSFKYVGSIKTGARPNRIAIQPDGRYVWVGHTGDGSGVTVIDAFTHEAVKIIATGAGHHEITFDETAELAFITNRESRTMSTISVSDLTVKSTLETDGRPISVAFSNFAQSVYLTDGDTGTLRSINPATGKARSIKLSPGIGPMGVSVDGRYLMVTNAASNEVNVVDTASFRTIKTLSVEGRPFHVAFSRNYAFIRSLDTNKVTMVQMASLVNSGEPIIQQISIGERAPADSPRIAPAGLIASAVTEAAHLIVSPGDATVYYYMEGMNAPMGSFRNYGHRPISALITDRTIKEEEPGIYRSRFKVPADGTFQFILTLDSPQVIHCFDFKSIPDPAVDSEGLPVNVEYLSKSGMLAEVGEPLEVRFRLHPSDGSARVVPFEVEALTYRAPGKDRMLHEIEFLPDGTYAFTMTPEEAGVYYLYLALPSEGLEFSQIPYLSIIARNGDGA
ncbi:MAG: hypothetical protein P8H62_14360 [Henriciella sp.]|nr:hypothetical protein [Henriciella sp.]